MRFLLKQTPQPAIAALCEEFPACSSCSWVSGTSDDSEDPCKFVGSCSLGVQQLFLELRCFGDLTSEAAGSRSERENWRKTGCLIPAYITQTMHFDRLCHRKLHTAADDTAYLPHRSKEHQCSAASHSLVMSSSRSSSSWSCSCFSSCRRRPGPGQQERQQSL